MKQNLIALALRGADHASLVNNLIAMKPDYWLAERILCGVFTVTPEMVQKHFDTRDQSNNKKVLSVEVQSAFEQNNVEVRYEYTDSTWANVAPPKELLTEKEFEEFKKNSGVSTNWRDTDTYCHKVCYRRATSNRYEMERFADFVEDYPLASSEE